MWVYFWAISLLSFLHMSEWLYFFSSRCSQLVNEAGFMLTPRGVLWKVKSSGFGHKSVYHEAVKPAQFSSRDFSQELYKPYTFRCLSNVKLLFLKKSTGRSWCDSLENNSQVTVYFRLFPPKKEKLIKCVGKVSRLKSIKGNQITELCKQRCDENWRMRWTKRSGLPTVHCGRCWLLWSDAPVGLRAEQKLMRRKGSTRAGKRFQAEGTASAKALGWREMKPARQGEQGGRIGADCVCDWDPGDLLVCPCLDLPG